LVAAGGSLSGLIAADIAAAVVLKNNVIVGSVNTNKRHWYKAGQVLAGADRAWVARLIARRERPEDFRQALQRQADDIKVVMQFAEACTRRVLQASARLPGRRKVRVGR
jgi:glucose 1-dehydrogenase